MKILKLILVVCLITSSVFAQESKDIKIIFPENRGIKIYKWEKIELGIVIPESIVSRIRNFVSNETEKDRINPFDPEQVSVEADFQYLGKSNELVPVRRIYGFYYEEYRRKKEDLYPDKWTWIVKRNDYPLRIRFAPDKVGEWKCIVKVVINKTAVTDLGAIKFECIESAAKGQIELVTQSDQRHNYLKYSDKNEMFFPVGINLAWAYNDHLRVAAYDSYVKWFEQLGNARANFVRLSMVGFSYGIERDVLNDYTSRLPNAWEFDELLSMATHRDIHVSALVMHHDEFIVSSEPAHKNYYWSYNGYNTEKNKGLTGAKMPIDFFTDEKCKAIFKKRLRYILSRYGYSTYFPIIELLSEVDKALPHYNDKSSEGTDTRKKFRQWFVEMSNYIKNDLGYSAKMISCSYSQEGQNKNRKELIYADADLVLLHSYGYNKTTNFKSRYLELVKELKSDPLLKNKPLIFDEMGANTFPALDNCSDITFHQNLWATSFMGCVGAGLNWWWNNAILAKGYEKNLAGLRKFLEDENFTVKEFVPEAFADNGKKIKPGTAYEAYLLKSGDATKAIGWLHSTDFNWANLTASNTCISKLVSDNNGSSFDEADKTAYGKAYNEMKATGNPVAEKGQSFELTLNPATEYLIKWYSTATGEAGGITEKVKSSSSGKVKFAIPEINFSSNPYGDFGFKIVVFSR